MGKRKKITLKWLDENVNELGGILTDIHYDKKVEKLNIQLIHIGGEIKTGDGFYAIQFEDWSEKRVRKLLRLHIKEAIELKAKLDVLIYNALSGEEL